MVRRHCVRRCFNDSVQMILPVPVESLLAAHYGLPQRTLSDLAASNTNLETMTTTKMTTLRGCPKMQVWTDLHGLYCIRDLTYRLVFLSKFGFTSFSHAHLQLTGMSTSQQVAVPKGLHPSVLEVGNHSMAQVMLRRLE